MKKIILFTSFILAATFANAGKNGVNSLLGSDKGMVSNGFYLFLGFGSTAGTITTSNYSGGSGNNNGNAYSYGYFGGLATASSYRAIHPSFEIGSQWMFYKTGDRKFGVGMNVSWISFGYGAYSTTDFDRYSSTYGATRNYSHVDIKPLRLGAIASYAFTDEMAVDALINVSPALNVGFNRGGLSQFHISYGALFIPGARFRYKIFAVGLEAQIGTLKGKAGYDREASRDNLPDESDIKITIFEPRLVVGFKF
jgi:hypothetical protein